MKKITKIGKKGLDLIKAFEGLSLKPYLCPAGIPTIGYGSTFYEDGTKVTLKDKAITEARATKMLLHEVAISEKYVDTFAKIRLLKISLMLWLVLRIMLDQMH